MTYVWRRTYCEEQSFVDNGNGNGVWTFATGDEYPSAIARKGGRLAIEFNNYYDDPNSGGQVFLNGDLVYPDMSVGWDYDRLNMFVEGILEPQTITIETVGLTMGTTWNSVNVDYISLFTGLYPIAWFNPKTGSIATSYEGGHLYDSTSNVFCPGHNATVIEEYQVWVGGEVVTWTRFRQRNDGLGTERPPRMSVDGNKYTSKQKSNRVGEANRYH